MEEGPLNQDAPDQREEAMDVEKKKERETEIEATPQEEVQMKDSTEVVDPPCPAEGQESAMNESAEVKSPDLNADGETDKEEGELEEGELEDDEEPAEEITGEKLPEGNAEEGADGGKKITPPASEDKSPAKTPSSVNSSPAKEERKNRDSKETGGPESKKGSEKESRGRDDKKRKHSKERDQDDKKKKKRKHFGPEEEAIHKRSRSHDKPLSYDMLLKQEMYLLGATSSPPEEFPPSDEDAFDSSAFPGRGHLFRPEGDSYDSGSGEEWAEFRRRKAGVRRRSRSRSPNRKNEAICMFFLQGTCQRGSKCPYSHEMAPTRKMELCKFYILDRCAKKEKCLYMHKDFPCKYYHYGIRCRAGEDCKFSHEPLHDDTRNILLKHIEMAPKDILGDFPRMSKHIAVAILAITEAKRKDEAVSEECLNIAYDFADKGFKYLDKALKNFKKKDTDKKESGNEKENEDKTKANEEKSKKSRSEKDGKEKDKMREKDREKERDKDRDRDRENHRDRDRERERDNRDRDRERDRDRDRNREKHRERGRNRSEGGRREYMSSGAKGRGMSRGRGGSYSSFSNDDPRNRDGGFRTDDPRERDSGFRNGDPRNREGGFRNDDARDQDGFRGNVLMDNGGFMTDDPRNCDNVFRVDGSREREGAFRIDDPRNRESNFSGREDNFRVDNSMGQRGNFAIDKFPSEPFRDDHQFQQNDFRVDDPINQNSRFRSNDPRCQESGFRSNDSRDRDGGFRNNDPRNRDGFRNDDPRNRDCGLWNDDPRGKENKFSNNDPQNRGRGFRNEDPRNMEGGFRNEGPQNREGGFRNDDPRSRESGFRNDDPRNRDFGFRAPRAQEDEFRNDGFRNRDDGFRNDEHRDQENNFRSNDPRNRVGEFKSDEPKDHGDGFNGTSTSKDNKNETNNPPQDKWYSSNEDSPKQVTNRPSIQSPSGHAISDAVKPEDSEPKKDTNDASSMLPNLAELDVSFFKNLLDTVHSNTGSVNSNSPNKPKAPQDSRKQESNSKPSNKRTPEGYNTMSNIMDLSNDIKDVFYDNPVPTNTNKNIVNDLQSLLKNARESSDTSKYNNDFNTFDRNQKEDYRSKRTNSWGPSDPQMDARPNFPETGHNIKGYLTPGNEPLSPKNRDPRTAKEFPNTREGLIKEPSDILERVNPLASDVDLRTLQKTKRNNSSDSKDSSSDIDMRTSTSIYDVDLRKLEIKVDKEESSFGSFPFKVPPHSPAKEIDGSLNSHPPMYYKLVEVTIPKPDFSHLKIDWDDPKVMDDPRLRRMKRKNSSDENLNQNQMLPFGSPTEDSVKLNQRLPVEIKIAPRDPRMEGAKTNLRPDPRIDPRSRDPRSATARSDPRVDNRMLPHDPNHREPDLQHMGPGFSNGMMDRNSFGGFSNMGPMPGPMMQPGIDPQGRPGLLGPAPNVPQGQSQLGLNMGNPFMLDQRGPPGPSFMPHDRRDMMNDGANFQPGPSWAGPKIPFNDPRLNRDGDLGSYTPPLS